MPKKASSILSKKLPLSQQLLQREPFVIMFYTINSSPLLVTELPLNEGKLNIQLTLNEDQPPLTAGIAKTQQRVFMCFVGCL